ncbi:MAG: hypothetical protein AB7N54_06765 [Alphaproteobacteria bacterium]
MVTRNTPGLARIQRASATLDDTAPPSPKVALDVIVLVLPLFLFQEVTVVGRLFLPEIIMAGMLPFLLMTRGRMLADAGPRTFFLLAFAWLASQVLTDLIRNTPFADYSRGWSKIFFTTTNFAVMYMLLYGSRRRIAFFCLSLTMGGFLTFFIHPADYAYADPWKFGVGIYCTFLVVLLTLLPFVQRVWILPSLLLAGIALLSVVLGSRSLGGITLMAALYIFVQQVVGRRQRAARPSLIRTLMFLGVGVFVAGGILTIYSQAAEQGLLGAEAREKYEFQAGTGGALAVLLGGRSEIFVASQAIADSPIIGHGSWAKNPEYAARLLLLDKFGYEVNYSAAESELIPTHSHLFGAWVESGTVGTFLWFWALFLALRVMSNMYLLREPMSPLIVFASILFAWDILFSPFGAERRIFAPFYIILLMFAWDLLRSNVPGDRLVGLRRRAPARPAMRGRAQSPRAAPSRPATWRTPPRPRPAGPGPRRP